MSKTRINCSRKALAIVVGAVLTATNAAATEIIFTIPSQIFSFDSVDIFLTSGSDTTATIKNADSTFSSTVPIAANSTTIVTIPGSYRIPSVGSVSNDGFSIASSDAIAAYLMDANVPVASNDITNLFPSTSLGTQFLVMAGTSNLVPSGSQMSFVASEDNTTVTITPSAALTTGQAAGVPFTVTLNKLQSLEYLANGTGDLTGTSIVSDKGIAVFGGHYCGNVPASTAFCDHLIEQIPSTNNFGTEFVLLPTEQGKNLPGDVVKILAKEDGTVVTLENSGGTTTYNLNAGQSVELPPALTENTAVNSNKPILVGQFMVGQTIAGEGDPAFSLVPDVNQWLKEYIFNVPAGDYSDFLGVAISADGLASLLLDGVAVDPTLFSAVLGTDFVAGNIPVADGSYRILASMPFMLMGHGFNDNFASYFGIGGSSVSGGGVEPPQPPLPVPGTALLMGLGLGALAVSRRRRS